MIIKYDHIIYNMIGSEFFCRPVTERHVIMICNSEPYDVPTREIRPYLGLKAEELVDKMAEV